MKKVKSHFSRFKASVKQKIGAGPGAHNSASLPDLTQPAGSESPVPREDRRAVTPLPSAPGFELPLPSSIHPILPVPVALDSVPSDGSANTKQGVPTGTQPRPSAPIPSVSQNSGSANVAPPLQEKSSSANWSGLELVVKALDSAAEIFPPFKAAINMFNDLVKMFEAAAADSNGYSKLQTQLNALLEDLGQHLDGMTNPRMSMATKNLCRQVIVSAAINAELWIVEQKLAGRTSQRHMEAIGNPDLVLECYQRIQNHLERLSEARLRQLLAVASAVYNSAASEEIQRRACTDGTRKDELATLLGWAHNKDGAVVYWMNGMAGTGKTTIAYSLCTELEKTAELAASFFCSRQIPECRDVKLIIPAIAYQLARFSLPFCHALLKVLEAEPDVHTRVLRLQFEYLLVKPLLEIQHTLPTEFIIVIDALDECAKEDSVGQILDVLLFDPSILNLPVRFLLSSRPEPQIYSRMMSRDGVGPKSRLVLHDLDESKVRLDIETYLRAELEHVPLTQSQLSALAAHSGVLFIYASTAARYIREGLPFRQHVKRLNMILGLAPPSEEGKDRDIDALYTSILTSTFESRRLDKSNRIMAKTLLDVVICAQEPLTVGVLSGLLGVEDPEQVDGLLRLFCSVLNIDESSRLVNTLHASFPDFMRNPARALTFHCDPRTTHMRIAQLAFNVIGANKPQFNVCTLESSYLRDQEVVDLTRRASQEISGQLFYACRYWMTHVTLGVTDDIPELLHEFLSERLLLWMEVLSLNKCMHLGPGILRLAAGWSSTHGCSKETIDLAHDAWRFVTMYTSHAISQSMPHIYISMLPFWPESAPVTNHYTKKMNKVIQVQGSAMTRRQLALLATWQLPGEVFSVCSSPEESLLACGIDSSVYLIDETTGRAVLGPLEHRDRVNSVAFSADGALVVSGSDDKTVKVWKTANGQRLTEPFIGHTDIVNCVLFLPKGDRVVSGSRDGTIRVWSLESGHTLVLGPLEDQPYRDKVWSICVSPSGTRITSGHGDGTICIWNAESEKILLGPLKLVGHTDSVSSMCFSPDGTCLVSGSWDKVIRLWNVATGQAHADIFQGHTGMVLSVAFSPDGKHIVSGSTDDTIRLWLADGQPQLVRVFTGHTNVVFCVRFSADGARIVSSSGDTTVRVWDARTQALPDTPLQGHTNKVTSVTFSHNATRILSGSDDGTIYIWDAHTGQIAVGPMEGHTRWVSSVCFSPDQSRVASGSGDKSVRLWDACTGQAAGPPLTGHSGRVLSVCFAPDGGLVASCSEDETVRLWDPQSGEPVGRPLHAHTSWVRSVCFSRDGLRIVSASDDKRILVWDLNTRQPALPPLKAHTDRVWALCVSPDGKRIASGSDDKTVRLWDAQSGQSVFDPLLGHTALVTSVCFSPDSSYVVSGSYDKTIRLWNAQYGQAVGSPLIGHTDGVRSVAFAPNGRQIVSGSEDHTIRLWDIADLVQVKQSQGGSDDSTKSPHTHQSWVLQDDGWVVDSDSRLLAWVPLDLHASLLSPRNPLLISTKGAVQLDVESAKLGESWVGCYTP